jgi:hypothetical protein
VSARITEAWSAPVILWQASTRSTVPSGRRNHSSAGVLARARAARGRDRAADRSGWVGAGLVTGAARICLVDLAAAQDWPSSRCVVPVRAGSYADVGSCADLAGLDRDPMKTREHGIAEALKTDLARRAILR